MRQNLLTRNECAAMRGIAILAIMLHNYCHWLNFAVKENEYRFFTDRAQGMWAALMSPDGFLPVQLVSFFGHYGVPVFLFLSGYGLVLKYEREGEPMHRPLPFITYHFKKLWGMMALGFVLFIIIDIMTPRSFHFHCAQLFEQAFMVINLFPDPQDWIWPGPYWFFGLMLQLYVIYALLFYRRRHWGWVVGLTLLCLCIQASCDPEGNILRRLRYNCIGGILPFGIGILCARHCCGSALTVVSKWQWALLCIVSSAAVIVMSLYFALWHFAPVMVIIGTICLAKALPSRSMPLMIWIGGISAALFVTHPAMRKIFIPVSYRGDVYDGIMLYVIASFGVAWVMTFLIQRIKVHFNE